METMSHPESEPGFKPEGPGPLPAAGGPFAEPPPSSRGCFFYGCLIMGIVSGLGLLLVVGGSVALWFWYKGLVNEYTETTPVPLPVAQVSEDERKDIESRWEAFRKALDEGKEAELVLNAEEINVLIEKEPKIKGKVYCKQIKDDEVTGQVSIPLGETGIPGLSGRYLNGSATFTGEI